MWIVKDAVALVYVWFVWQKEGLTGYHECEGVAGRDPDGSVQLAPADDDRGPGSGQKSEEYGQGEWYELKIDVLSGLILSCQNFF